MAYLLLFTVFVISTCGLIYELVAGALSSYLLGDSVTQFSTVIGVYLFSMGIGAFFSKYIRKDLLRIFIVTEVLTGLVGGFSSIVLFVCFSFGDYFRLVLYGLVLITGTLIGLEIPLVMRILKNRIEFKDLVSKVFTFDYIGALLASLLFPLLLVPHLGLIRTSTFFGMMNVSLAIYLAYYFRSELRSYGLLLAQGVVSILFLLVGFAFSSEILNYSESQLYGEKIIYSTSSPYQRIVITRNGDDLRLYLNNNLQFSSADEYRYHESLVHPAFCFASGVKSVLVLGGGDGLAAREILKYPGVTRVVLVDLDKKLTDLFVRNALLRRLNAGSLTQPKLALVNADAFEWLKQTSEVFDVVVIDFPDPSNYAVGKLYTTAFYKLIKKVMHQHTVAVVQSTSPLVAPRSFWCVDTTLRSVNFQSKPYHVYVPSFGEWGFVLFSKSPMRIIEGSRAPADLKFFSGQEFNRMTYFSSDMRARPGDVQRLDNQVLVEYFEKEWGGNL